jgi:type II secretory pathway component PulF
MNNFAYQARDAQGKPVSGIAVALNEDNAINTLMSRGLMVISTRSGSAM